MTKKIVGNTTTTPIAPPDWNQTDETKADYIKNKPSINGMELSGDLELNIPMKTSELENDRGFVAQETDPTIAKWAKAELFDKNGLKDYIKGGGLVTIDNVEYFRYHAGATNFTYTNPNPQEGSVKITMRALNQYGSGGTTRIHCYYSDGTNTGYGLYVPLTGEIWTYTTPADKTLVSIKGNYDLENWVLLDMSVMSLRANYPAPATVKYVDDLVGDISVITDYEDLENKPSINGVELSGDVEIKIPTKTSDLENDTGYINTSEIVDDLCTYDGSKPLSANMGAALYQDKIGYGDIVDNLCTYDNKKPLSASAGAYLYSEIPTLMSELENDVNLLDSYAGEGLIYEHDVNTSNHSDIRYEIQQIADRLTAFLDTDDTTLDQLSEIVAYINSNKELIDAITTSKVNVVDIIDDLNTNMSDKPLSAAQGVQLKTYLDSLAQEVYGFLDNTSDSNMYPLSNLIQQINNKIDYTSVVDNLTSWDQYSPLSAYQGMILDSNKINYTDIVDSFDNVSMYSGGGSYNPLSARLGYELYQGKIGYDSLVTDPTSMSYEDNKSVLSAYYGKQLYDYITLVAENIPTYMSQLNNDNYYVQDPYYVHTTNDFADNYKNILDNYEVIDDLNNISSSDYSYSYKLLSARVGKYLEEFISSAAQSIPYNMSQLNNDSGYAYLSDIPSNMSQLNNDSYYIVDSSYVHTDNNFTNEYKEKLDNLGENPGGSGSGGISHSWNGTVLTITSDSGTSSVDLKGDKGDPPNIEFHYDEETGNLYYKIDGTLVDGEYVATNNLVSKEYVENYVNESILGGAW